jgi:hypothetical protein
VANHVANHTDFFTITNGMTAGTSQDCGLPFCFVPQHACGGDVTDLDLNQAACLAKCR